MSVEFLYKTFAATFPLYDFMWIYKLSGLVSEGLSYEIWSSHGGKYDVQNFCSWKLANITFKVHSDAMLMDFIQLLPASKSLFKHFCHIFSTVHMCDI
jgi:hypothetical protein